MKRIDTTGLKSVLVGIDTHEGETGKNNEDTGGFFAYQLSERNDTVVHLGVVADGIGGHQAGERASQMGVAILESYFTQATSPRILHHFDEAFKAANARILAEGKRQPELAGMGTTMTAAVIMNNCLYVAHVGDSRAYLIRNGSIHQLTTDHTWAQEAIEAGRLTPAEAKTHPNRNVIKRYMGIQPNMEVDFRLSDPDKPGPADEQNQGMVLKRGDVILLCSDGLSDLVEDPDILAAVKDEDPQHAAERLVRMARAAGGYDNITVVAIQVRTGAPAAATAGSRLKLVGVLGIGLVVLAAAAGAAAMFLGGDRGPGPTATPVATLVEPTATPSMTSTPSPTAPTATATLAPVVAPSEAATPTPIATTPAPGETTVPATPTSVPTFTPTDTPTATNTPRPPTATPTPTETLEPTLTETAAPPPGDSSPPPEPTTETPPPRPITATPGGS